jgi:hypothetical protein
MFGRLAAAQLNQQSVADIEPQFHPTASTCEAAAGAASPDRPKNKSAVDSVVLSLIPLQSSLASSSVVYSAPVL